jgi:RNA polymerase sigma factor (sigma-70 family)
MDERVCFENLSHGGTVANAAVAQLYDAYARRFLAWLRCRGFSLVDSEDIVQDAFVRIFKMSGKELRTGSPQAYLWKILVNCSYDKVKSQKRNPSTETGATDDQIDNLVGQQSNVVEAREFELCFAAALDAFRVSEPERAVAIELAVIEGFACKELATVLGRSYGATREFLSQCRKKFGDLLRSRCGDFLEESP